MSINLNQPILNMTNKGTELETVLPTITTTTTRSSILTKQPTIILATSTQSQPTQVEQHVITQQAPIVTIKTEPLDFIDFSESTGKIHVHV